PAPAGSGVSAAWATRPGPETSPCCWAPWRSSCHGERAERASPMWQRPRSRGAAEGGAQVTDAVWFPSDPGATNVGRFMAAHGIDHFDELVRRSIDEPEWFWDAVVGFLGIEFGTPYGKVLDTSDGIPWAKWFVGGALNFAHV